MTTVDICIWVKRKQTSRHTHISIEIENCVESKKYSILFKGKKKYYLKHTLLDCISSKSIGVMGRHLQFVKKERINFSLHRSRFG